MILFKITTLALVLKILRQKILTLSMLLLFPPCFLASTEETVSFAGEKTTINRLFEKNLSYTKHLIIESRPHPLLQRLKNKPKNTKKYIAAALAFPFPFGIVGLHRIYLGCAPYVPVAYIASVGGGFGILPFLDFCAILSHKNTDTFVNNKKVFMWVE